MNSRLVSIASVSVVTFFFLASSGVAQTFKWDTRYVPSDSFLTVSLNAQRILSYEKKDSDLRKFLDEKTEKFTTIKLGDIEQLQFCFAGMLEDGQKFSRKGDELLTVKLVFNTEQAMEKFLDKASGGGDVEELKHNGHKLTKVQHGPTFFIADNKTIILGETAGVKHAMENENAMSGFIDRMKDADGEADAYIQFENNATTAAMISEIADQAEGLPFNIKDIAAEAKHGYIIADMGSGHPIKAEIVAKNAEGAQRLQRTTDALVGLGKVFLPKGREEIEREIENMKDEGGGPGPFGPDFGARMKEQMQLGLRMIDLGDSILEGFDTSTRENKLNVKVTVMGGMPQLVSIVGEQVASAMKMMERFMDGIAVEAEVEAIELIDGPDEVIEE